VDGIFGPNTEKATRDFQKFAGKVIDGIVGPNTWKTILEPAKIPATNLRKFKAQLGTVADFVQHVQLLELRDREPQRLFQALSDFGGTTRGARYLIIKQDPRVIDFRHFFAAAGESYGSIMSRGRGLPIGGSRGEALLLGVGNEIAQCIDEGLKSKLNSCFSREDLGSNRLGAEFGRLVKIAQAENRKMPIYQQLNSFLRRVAPAPPKAIGGTELPGAGTNFLESAAAIVAGIIDILLPEAY
jgi:hypothetical protein